MAKLLKVDNVCPANKYLLTPLEINEKVIVLEDNGGQFIKVRHNKGKVISVFSRSYFKPVSEADRKTN